MKRRLTRIAGFTLLPVILTMTLIAAIAFLLNRDNGMNAGMVASQSDADRARYAAEAGLQAVNANMQDNNCSGFYYNILTPLTNSNFGGASYTAFANPGFGWPVTLVSTGTYNGTSVTLSRSNVQVYKTTPSTYTLQPNAAAGIDSYIISPTNGNNGDKNDLSVKASGEYPLLQFDLSMFPAGSLPLSATISLYGSGVPGSLNPIAMHRLTNSWVEGNGTNGSGVSWSTRDGTMAWTTPGGDYHPVPAAAAPTILNNAWNDFSTTDLVTAWMQGRYPNYGVLLRPDPSSGNYKFISSDNADATQRPKVTFNYLLPCGTTGPSACTAGNIRDDFNAIAYTGNNGSVNWSGNWTETGEADGATTGKLSVLSAAQCASGSCLKLRNDTATVMRITRGADLSSAVSATLKFNYRRTMVAGSGGNIRLEISKDGGTNFTLLKNYPLTVTDSAQIAENIDISAYIAANTQIRFSTDGSNIQTNIHIDNIEIITSCAAAPGTTVTLSPIADSFNDSGAALANNGAATTIKTYYTPTRENRVLAQFDTSSIPAGKTILSAKLRMFVSAVGSATSNTKSIWANALNESWVEGAGNNTNKACPTVTAGTSWNYRTDCTNWSYIHPPNTAQAWTAMAAMPTARTGHVVATVNNKIYAIGGSNLTAELNVVEEYDPATNTWATKAPMPTARWWARAAVVNGKIYVIGGEKTAVSQSVNEMYDPATNTWTTKAPMPTARKAQAAAVVNDKIYLFGGGTTATATNINYEYDPATNTWASKAAMPTARNWPSAEAANGKIYVFGGSAGPSYLTNNEVYDPASNTWSTKTAMPVGLDVMASEVLGNKIYLVAGRRAGPAATNGVQRYDVLSDSYTTMTNYPISIWYAEAAAVNSKIYVMGGNNGVSVVANHYRYDPGLPVPVATASDEATSASPLAAGFASGWINFDLKPLVQEWVDGVRPNNGVVIYTEVADQFSINSRENSANKPQLIVTY